MNTNRLVSEYKHVYKNFFNKYDIVISSPIVVTLVGDVSVFSKGNSSLLTQKITLRNYIGYNFNKSLDDIEYIVKEGGGGFVNQNIENKYPISQKILKTIGLKGSIGFLSEYDTTNPPSVISNLLSLKLLVDKKISIGDFEKLDLDNKGYIDILDEFLNLDKQLIEKYNFFGGTRNNSLYIGTSLLKSDSHFISTQDGKKYKYKNVGNFSDFNQLNLTFSLINPNLITKNNYSSAFLNDKTRKLFNFINDIGIEGKKIKDIDLFEGINNIGNFYAIKIFQDLYRLYKSNFSGNNFYRDLNIYRETIKSLFNNQKNELKINNVKKQILELIKDNNFDFYIDHFGVFGTIKYAVFNNKTGYIDEELINKLNKEKDLNFILDYSSFYDGYEKKGTKLEQYRSEGETSIFSSNYALYTYNKGYTNNISGDYSDFIGGNIGGLILDLISKKIYLDGKKLTSKELHSQNTTIDILEILLSKIGEDVSSKQLPKSSYSSNKNEMLGKIVIPLVKLIEKEKKIKLPFICKGSLGDFYLKLNDSDLEISVIKKLS